MAKGVWALVHEDQSPDGKKVYGISFPDFPGVATAGVTIDEAVERGRTTLAFHVEGMLEDGETIPEPSSLEVIRAGEWRADLTDIDHVALVEVPFDLPGKSISSTSR